MQLTRLALPLGMAALAAGLPIPNRTIDSLEPSWAGKRALASAQCGPRCDPQEGRDCVITPCDQHNCNGCDPTGRFCPNSFGFRTGNICGAANAVPNQPCYAVAQRWGGRVSCPKGWAATQFCSSGHDPNCPNPSPSVFGHAHMLPGSQPCNSEELKDSPITVPGWLYCSFFVGSDLANTHADDRLSGDEIEAFGGLANGFGQSNMPNAFQDEQHGGSFPRGYGGNQLVLTGYHGDETCPQGYVVTGSCLAGAGNECGTTLGTEGEAQCTKVGGQLGEARWPEANAYNEFISPMCPVGSIMVSASQSGTGPDQHYDNESPGTQFTSIKCAEYTAPPPPPIPPTLPSCNDVLKAEEKQNVCSNHGFPDTCAGKCLVTTPKEQLATLTWDPTSGKCVATCDQ